MLTNPELRAAWEQEVAEMRDRIKAMRHQLYETLTAKVPGKISSYDDHATWHVQLYRFNARAS